MDHLQTNIEPDTLLPVTSSSLPKAATPAKPEAPEHKPTKLSARERLETLFDPGTFFELDQDVLHNAKGFGLERKRIPGDGVITGFGAINGRTVYAFAQDFSVMGGSVGQAHAKKICKAMDHAAKAGAPFIALVDSGGARIQEGILSLAGYGAIFARNTRYSGVIPQISVILGPCAGGAVYSPSVTDFVVMTKQSYMFVTGPKVVKTATHEDTNAEDLGGGGVHGKITGVAHHVAEDDMDALMYTRALLEYLPSNNLSEAPPAPVTDEAHRETPELEAIVPLDTKKSYDVRKVIDAVADYGSFLELHRDFATNIVVGFARMEGRSVGIIANQPNVLAGVLDINASRKAARFIRFCNAFNLPLLTLIDVPGFLPGTGQEHDGIINHGAKLLYAYCEATVPKISLVMRKAYGGAYIVMSSKEIGGDYCLAWPNAEIAVMGSRGAVEILHRKELKGAVPGDPEFQEREDEYKDQFCNVRTASENGLLDAVIDPAETRKAFCQLLRSIEDKHEHYPQKRNGNIPL